MSREMQGAVSLLLGIVTLRISLSSIYLNFVRAGMRPLLIAAGAMLVFLGVVSFLQAARERREPVQEHADDHDDHGHHHHKVPIVTWLLLLPVFTLLIVTPNPLGAFAADRQSGGWAIDAPTDWGPLPDPVRGAVELNVSEFSDRALYDAEESLRDVPVRLVGFVAPAALESDADFLLTRFLISCCAADARPIQVAVYGATAPPIDSWIEITGRWLPDAAEDRASIAVERAVPIPQPESPYETF